MLRKGRFLHFVGDFLVFYIWDKMWWKVDISTKYLNLLNTRIEFELNETNDGSNDLGECLFCNISILFNKGWKALYKLRINSIEIKT